MQLTKGDLDASGQRPRADRPESEAASEAPIRSLPIPLGERNAWSLPDSRADVTWLSTTEVHPGSHVIPRLHPVEVTHVARFLVHGVGGSAGRAVIETTQAELARS